MMMNRALLALVTMLLLVVATAAQIRVNVELVNVVVTVTDSNGRYVSGLKASDFALQEDGVVREVSHFGFSNDLPVSVGIVFDSSASMEKKLATATRAVDRFLQDIHEDDDIFFLTFDESVKLRQDFTSAREKLSNALGKVKLAYGTALYDGVIAGIDRARKGKHSKKALLLISDGLDSTSQRSHNDARAAVRESRVLVYALGITANNSAGGDTVDMEILNSFASDSGGKAWSVAVDTQAGQLQEALDEIAEELRSQYNLGYYPGHDLKDGKRHRIQITNGNPEYRIRYKQEYVGQ
jgi:Ca-activated chloride channel family protein